MKETLETIGYHQNMGLKYVVHNTIWILHEAHEQCNTRHHAFLLQLSIAFNEYRFAADPRFTTAVRFDQGKITKFRKLNFNVASSVTEQ